MRHQHLQNDRAAMALQLQHILTGVTVWRGKKHRQHLVYGLLVGVFDGDQMRLPRLQLALGELLGKAAELLAA